MKTEYRILRQEKADMLESDVAMHLALGWELQGGVSVSMTGYEYQDCGVLSISNDIIYAQAVILRELPVLTASDAADLYKTVLGNLMPFILEDYHPNCATTAFRSAVEAAKELFPK